MLVASYSWFKLNLINVLYGLRWPWYWHHAESRLFPIILLNAILEVFNTKIIRYVLYIYIYNSKWFSIIWNEKSKSYPHHKFFFHYFEPLFKRVDMYQNDQSSVKPKHQQRCRRRRNYRHICCKTNYDERKQ